ncbi:MAG TPA: YbaN family protein [Devosia sp.]|nr:YbaN family protein [Devosia sp.]
MTGLRAINLILGAVMLAVGVLGAILPLLPSTPFLLAAAWFFSRGSPRAEQWLLQHPVLGRPLRNWRRERALSNCSKVLAIGMMAASYALLLFGTQPGLPLLIGTAVILTLAGSFIVTRPKPLDDTD